MFNDTPIRIAVTCVVAALCMACTAWAVNNRSRVASYGSDLNGRFNLAPPHDATLDGGEVDLPDPGEGTPAIDPLTTTIDGGNLGYFQSSTPSAAGNGLRGPA